jgi:O-methyltransferase
MVDRIDFTTIAKELFLYDLFEWNEGDQHTRHTGHTNENMHEDLVARFADQDFVRIIKGFVPVSFAEALPEKIAFAHIDMNHPTPEVGALKHVLPRLSSGGVVILDDYGWWHYSAQKRFIDPVLEAHDLSVLELPIGQGLIIK